MRKATTAVLGFALLAIVFAALWFAAGWVTMLMVGALHSAVPVVPAISFVGALWFNLLVLWLRAIFASGNTSK